MRQRLALTAVLTALFAALNLTIVEPVTQAAKHEVTEIPASWISATRDVFARPVNGRNVYQYVVHRARHRKAGEKLAIVLGIDHVSSYEGLQVRPTYRLYRLALRHGYEVHFITGSGPVRAQRLLQAGGFDHYTSVTTCRDTDGLVSQGRCKGAVRQGLVNSGLTLVVNAGSNVYSWRFGPKAERTLKLPW